jgi:hypothetical protein
MYTVKASPGDSGVGVLRLTASSSVCEQCFFEQPVVASVNMLVELCTQSEGDGAGLRSIAIWDP